MPLIYYRIQTILNAFIDQVFKENFRITMRNDSPFIFCKQQLSQNSISETQSLAREIRLRNVNVLSTGQMQNKIIEGISV